MQAIGIEKGKAFKPDDDDEGLAVGGGAPGRSDGAGQHLWLGLGRISTTPTASGRACQDGMTYTFARRRRTADRRQEQRLLHGCRQLAGR